MGAAGAMKRWEEIVSEITECEEIENASADADYVELARQPDHLQLSETAFPNQDGISGYK